MDKGSRGEIMTAEEHWNFWRKCKLLQWKNPFAPENWSKKESEK